MEIKTRASGKILLLGGYSVLERPNVGLVLAVNAYVYAMLHVRFDDTIKILIPQFKIKIDTTTNEIINLKSGVEKFVVSAIVSSLHYFSFKTIHYTGFKITTKSDKAFSVNKGKSGLGSSAAVTVAVVKALFEAFAPNEPKDAMHMVAQYAHAVAQEKVGSGFDIAAAFFGTIEYVRYSKELIDVDDYYKSYIATFDYEIKKVKLPSFHVVFANFPNQSMSTTNAILQVMEFKKNYPHEYSVLMHDLNVENKHAIESLEKNNLDEFKKHVEHGRKLTKELGILAGVPIESDEMTQLIKETENNGAFIAKLPGAGGADSLVAICLTKDKAEQVTQFLEKKGLHVMQLAIL